MRAHVTICIAVFVLFTGCTAVPFDGPSEQERPVTVVLNNSANETQAFEVWVVEAPSTATTQLDDGRTGNYTIGEGLRSHSSGDYHFWTTVELPESARLHSRVKLNPGEVNQSTVDEFPQNFAVVVVLYQDSSKSGWWASANCADQALVGLEVTSRPDKYGDAFASYGCR
jgi:hypothetical protein